jgi:glycosyltransferase involved in cell wall biosynthesis
VAHRLPELLEAFVSQDGEWEFIVVVYSKFDSTVEILDSFRGRLPLRPVVLEKQSGVVSALNAGIEAAKELIVVRCDDDLTPDPRFLSLHLRHHQGPEPVGVIGPTRDVFQVRPMRARTGYLRTGGPSPQPTHDRHRSPGSVGPPTCPHPAQFSID